MPFLVAEILNFQGSAHHVGVGSLSYKYFLLFLKVVPRWKSIRLLGLFFQKDKHYIVSKLEIEYIAPLRYFPPKPT
mgnify:CR=1 FL=1